MTVEFLDDAAQLPALVARFADYEWLAVDTEFLREKTYFPQLCLIQIASPDWVVCVDPLAIENLHPLFEALYAKTLVFHAARQDLELFYLLYGALPARLFDTQLAATILGYGEQIGYGNLVKLKLDVDLDKAHSRTDWTQRPLSAAQLEYAADDVRYLSAIYPMLRDEVDQLQRAAWLHEDYQELQNPHSYQADSANLWKRIKGFGKLKPQALARLQQLAIWREQQAIARNKPRKWVLKDEPMLDIARLAPDSMHKLAQIRGLEPRDIQRDGAAILAILDASAAIPESDWPQLKKVQVLSPQQDALVDVCMGMLRKLADEQQIVPSAVAHRKDLEALVRGDEECALLRGWRYPIIGRSLETFLQGQSQLQCHDQQLLMIED